MTSCSGFLKRARGDPRRSIEERYENFEAYRSRFAEAYRKLIEQRYFLQEDADRQIAEREKVRSLFR